MRQRIEPVLAGRSTRVRQRRTHQQAFRPGVRRPRNVRRRGPGGPPKLRADNERASGWTTLPGGLRRPAHRNALPVAARCPDVARPSTQSGPDNAAFRAPNCSRARRLTRSSSLDTETTCRRRRSAARGPVEQSGRRWQARRPGHRLIDPGEPITNTKIHGIVVTQVSSAKVKPFADYAPCPDPQPRREHRPGSPQRELRHQTTCAANTLRLGLNRARHPSPRHDAPTR